MDTVKIRYIGPQREGVWTGGDHAFDFAHPEAADDEAFVDVPVALAVELMGQLEPVPPGDPVWDDDAQQFVTKLAPVWELEPGAVLPEPEPAPAADDKPKSRPRTRTSASNAR